MTISDGITEIEPEPLEINKATRTLAVTEEELIAAYSGEMRERMTAELLDHPDLAALDGQLDTIARPD